MDSLGFSTSSKVQKQWKKDLLDQTTRENRLRKSKQESLSKWGNELVSQKVMVLSHPGFSSELPLTRIQNSSRFRFKSVDFRLLD